MVRAPSFCLKLAWLKIYFADISKYFMAHIICLYYNQINFSLNSVNRLAGIIRGSRRMGKCTRKWKLKGYFLAVMGVTFVGVETAADTTNMFDGLFMTEVQASVVEIGTANITIDIADWESGTDRYYTSSNGVEMYVQWNAESSASVFIDNGNGYTATPLYDGSSQTGSAQAYTGMNYITVNYNVIDSSDTTATADTTDTSEPTETKTETATDETLFFISYQSHISDIGWQVSKYDGELSGTEGESRRLEAIRIKMSDSLPIGDITYRTHVQDYGWLNWVSNGELSGTEGKAKRLEAIEIKLTGDLAQQYDIYYRVHAQHVGWLDWAKNGESSGTAGYGYRLEAIEIKLVEKNGEAPGAITRPFVKYPTVSYQTHVQNVGWQPDVRNGESSGTTGQSLRLEGIKIRLTDLPYAGSISYSTHIQNIGWQNDVSDGLLSGTTGLELRLEAIKIKLNGEMANNFDIYYRVHAQNFGWMGWAKNGEPVGTAEYSYRLEAIQIKIMPKGSEAPGNTTGAFVENPKVVLNVPFVSQLTPTYAPMGCEGASLLMGLQYKGYTNVSLKTFLDKMPKNSNNPFESFASSPYKIVNGAYQSIFPQALATYGKTYSGKVADATGFSTAQLKVEIKQGNPVVVYVTNKFAAPIWGIYYMGSAGYVRTVDNMHVMTLIGYDEETGNYLVNDPNSYVKSQYWVTKEKFEKAYDALKYAVVVR